jgi:hypothetical protein
MSDIKVRSGPCPLSLLSSLCGTVLVLDWEAPEQAKCPSSVHTGSYMMQGMQSVTFKLKHRFVLKPLTMMFFMRADALLWHCAVMP